MATFFNLIFPEIDEFNTETQVCCPFPHFTTDGKEYYETNPSAGVNTDKKVVHCFSCGRGLTELGFIQEYMGIEQTEAAILKSVLDTHKDIDYWDSTLEFVNKNALEYAINDLGISEKVIKELRIKYLYH